MALALAAACSPASPEASSNALGDHALALRTAPPPDHLTLSLSLDGHPYELRLQRSAPRLATNYQSYRFAGGALRASNDVPNLDCLYSGRVEPEDPASAASGGFASVNLCRGAVAASDGQSVRGVLRAAGRLWSITPDPADLDGSDGIDHLAEPLVRGDTPLAERPLLRHTRLSRKLETPAPRLSYQEGTLAETKYIDLIVMHDAARVDNVGADAEIDGIEFVAVMNAVLADSGLVPRLRVTLRAQVSFDQDPYVPAFVGQEVDHDSLMAQFLAWADDEDLPVHDEHMLLSGLDFLDSTVGYAGLSVACSTNRNGFIVQAENTGAAFAVLSAVHELGHTLGMGHDGDGTNACEQSGFIMASVGCGNCPIGDDRFSSCSVEEFDDYLSGPAYAEGSRCADDVPVGTPLASCGDGVVSAGEQCDCGESDCSDVDPCCNGATCQLVTGAECSDYNDGCCESCSVVSATENRVCRSAQSSCDIEERCAGSKACPPDSFDPAGEACQDPGGNAGNCYLGQCRSRATQCELLAPQVNFPGLTAPGPLCNPGCGEVVCGDGGNGCVTVGGPTVLDGVSCDGGQCVGEVCTSLIDQCPGDPLKAEPGVCGCGQSEADPDGDGTPSCVDACPADAQKREPGVCGCGQSDADGDADGAPNCEDACPNDGAKQAPGTCGCGQSDGDSDGDGTADCDDECADDPNSVSAGECGCGVAEVDTDGDGVADCNDACPNDASGSEEPCSGGVSNPDGDGSGFSVSASSSGGCALGSLPAHGNEPAMPRAAWLALLGLSVVLRRGRR